jgi:outer membrane protein assembly factor BamE (lipoprotein component of BamABCDE complex)
MARRSPATSWESELFHRQSWQASAEGKRYRFVNDLLERNLVIGKTREQVAALLGAPGFVSPDKRYVTYVVKGTRTGKLSFASVYVLHIEFDERGLAARAVVKSE